MIIGLGQKAGTRVEDLFDLDCHYRTAVPLRQVPEEGNYQREQHRGNGPRNPDTDLPFGRDETGRISIQPSHQTEGPRELLQNLNCFFQHFAPLPPNKGYRIEMFS
ncbi:hypothetical protein D3C85_1297730 [compost metagenome]